jgi:hypothetical protein
MALGRIGGPTPVATYQLSGMRDIAPEKLRFAPNGEWLACALEAEMGLWAWRMWDREPVELSILGAGFDLAFSPASDRLAVMYEESIAVFEWPACRELVRFARPPGMGDYACYFVGADYLVMNSEDELHVWHVHKGTEQVAYKGDLHPVCLWHNELVGFAGTDHCLWAVNLRNLKRTLVAGPVRCPPGHEALSQLPLQFTRDLCRALICIEWLPASKYELWDLETVRICGKVTAADFASNTPLLSADGRYVVGASGAWDQILIWDTLHDRLVHRLAFAERRSVDSISSTHFIFATIANWADKQIDQTSFYDASSGACIGETSGHAPDLQGSTFSPCGRWFASVVEDYGGRYWQPPPRGTVVLSDLQPILARATPIGEAPA